MPPTTAPLSVLSNGLPPTGIDVLPSIADSVVCTDETGRVLLFNKAAERTFGYSAAEVLRKDIGILLPQRHREHHADYVCKFAVGMRKADGLMGGRRPVWGRRKNGDEFPAEASISRHSFDGKTVLTVILRDVSEQKEKEERREAIAQELDHRIRNVLSVVGALVSLTAKSASSVEEFRDSLQDRLGGLAATQSFLERGKGKNLSLHSLLLAELAHYRRPDGLNLNIVGASVALRATAVQPLALAFHELATNSAKYGALSVPAGCVTINAGFVGDGDLRVLEIEWRETCGPPVRPSDRLGFGSILIEQLIKKVFQGELELDLRPEGLVCRMTLPAAKMEDDQSVTSNCP